MRARIAKIGNSRGIRIPRPVLDQVGFSDEVELRVEGNTLVIASPYRARLGWSEAFARMANRGDDALLDGDVAVTSWDEDDWEWR